MSKTLERWFVSGAWLIAACGGAETGTQGAPATEDTQAPRSAAAAGTNAGAAAATTSAGRGAANASDSNPAATAGNTATHASDGNPAAVAGANADDTAANAGASAPTSNAGMSETTPGDPTFTNVYNALFAVAGTGGCYGCHGGLANPALNGNFAMLSDQATTYKALVSAPSSEASVCKDMIRVTPSDPMTSLLYLKLSGMQPCGMPMPPGTPLDADIVSMIEAWIRAGAQDD